MIDCVSVKMGECSQKLFAAEAVADDVVQQRSVPSGCCTLYSAARFEAEWPDRSCTFPPYDR